MWKTDNEGQGTSEFQNKQWKTRSEPVLQQAKENQ